GRVAATPSAPDTARGGAIEACRSARAARAFRRAAQRTCRPVLAVALGSVALRRPNSRRPSRLAGCLAFDTRRRRHRASPAALERSQAALLLARRTADSMRAEGPRERIRWRRPPPRTIQNDLELR